MRFTARWVIGGLVVACMLLGMWYGISDQPLTQTVTGHAVAQSAAIQGSDTDSSTAPKGPTRVSSVPELQSAPMLAATPTVTTSTSAPEMPTPAKESSSTRDPGSTFESTSPSPLPAKGVKVAFVGDSYTNGTGASDHSKRWTDLISTARGWDEVNLGAGGTGYVTVPTDPEKACGRSFCPNYVAQAQQAVLVDPQIVIVSGGRNDLTAVAHDPGRVRVAVGRVLATLRAGLPQARIIAIAPFWDSSTPSTGISELADWLRSAAAKYGADFIPDAANYLLGRPDAIWHDGVHPNDLGYAIIAQRVDEALSDVLGSPSDANRAPPGTGPASTPSTVPPVN